MELAVFLLQEWNLETTDIREQFPLPIETTRTLAEEAGIKHPAVSGVDQYMTTDFRVSTSDPGRPELAIQAKTAADLTKLEMPPYWVRACVSSRRLSSP